VELLTKVMKYFSMFQSKNVPQSQEFATEVSDARSREPQEGAKVAAIAAALHHHAQENDDVRARVAAIAAAIHHHELENSQNSGLLGVAAVVAAIHHHNLKK
jgi:Na+-transporting methylmalonyl-CoA/oxaloacetate decarboxylase gamma subunit